MMDKLLQEIINWLRMSDEKLLLVFQDMVQLEKQRLLIDS